MKKPLKPKPPTIQQLEQQKRIAYRDGDVEKAGEIEKKLNFFYWGIK